MGFTDDVFAALDIQDELQTLYTSGTVFHAFLGERLPDWRSAAALVRKIAENYKLPYYTLSPTYSICIDHGYLAGEVYTCPICGKKTEVNSRITGYYRPVQNWNDGKAQEFKQRKEYVIATSKLRHQGVIQHASDCPPVTQEKVAEVSNELKLFTTKTCPNCKIAKQMLEKAGIAYENLYADEHKDEALSLGINQAPTLVVGGNKYKGVPEIKKYIESLS